MADLSDVQSALATLIAQTLYPNGTGQASVPGVPIRVYPGWPVPSQLDSDLAAGISHISVFNRPESRKVTRYPSAWQVLSIDQPTLTLTVSGNTITVGGALPAPYVQQNMTVLIGGQAFVYPTQANDTLTSIATGLAAQIAQAIPGTVSSGPVVTLPVGGPIPTARVGTLGTTAREVGRWQQVFQITVWSDTPSNRSAIGKVIVPVLMDTPWLTMPDGFAARHVMQRQSDSDSLQKAGLYRRDIFVQVEYAETMTQQAATVEAVTVTQFNIDTGAKVSSISY
jgi:hypothetical protein